MVRWILRVSKDVLLVLFLFVWVFSVAKVEVSEANARSASEQVNSSEQLAGQVSKAPLV